MTWSCSSGATPSDGVIGLSVAASRTRLRHALHGAWLLALSGGVSIVFGGLLAARAAGGALALLVVIAVYALVVGVAMIGLGLRLHRFTECQPASTSTRLPSGNWIDGPARRPSSEPGRTTPARLPAGPPFHDKEKRHGNRDIAGRWSFVNTAIRVLSEHLARASTADTLRGADDSALSQRWTSLEDSLEKAAQTLDLVAIPMKPPPTTKVTAWLFGRWLARARSAATWTQAYRHAPPARLPAGPPFHDKEKRHGNRDIAGRWSFVNTPGR